MSEAKNKICRLYTIKILFKIGPSFRIRLAKAKYIIFYAILAEKKHETGRSRINLRNKKALYFTDEDILEYAIYNGKGDTVICYGIRAEE